MTKLKKVHPESSLKSTWFQISLNCSGRVTSFKHNGHNFVVKTFYRKRNQCGYTQVHKNGALILDYSYTPHFRQIDIIRSTK